MRVRWLRAAMESLDEVYEHIASENPSAAKRVFFRILATTERLGEFPRSCPAGPVVGTHELVVAGLPYVIVYRVGADQVEILRVFHTSTDWLRMLRTLQ
jgi:toxin ParE1/3/4